MPQRIRAGCDGFMRSLSLKHLTLPQRIRAGCDAVRMVSQPVRYLCLSAFARVATKPENSGSTVFNAFASAHSRGLRPGRNPKGLLQTALPQRIRAGCDFPFLMSLLYQTTLCHSAFVRVATRYNGKFTDIRALCHSAFVRVATAEKQCSALRICCEKVDSFSSVGESGLALTIFPFSFAAKATYVAINDSFGRAIDRFFGANRTGISVSYDFAEHPCL